MELRLTPKHPTCAAATGIPDSATTPQLPPTQAAKKLRIGPRPFPVPPAESPVDGAGPQRGRKDGPPDHYFGATQPAREPLFLWIPKTVLFPAGKKKRVLSSSQSPHRCVLTSFTSLALPSWAGLARSTVRPFPTRLVSLVGFPRLSGISHSASLLVLSPRRHKLRIPHPAASGRLRSLRCSGSPGKRHSAFCRVPILLRWARAGTPFLHVVWRAGVVAPHT